MNRRGGLLLPALSLGILLSYPLLVLASRWDYVSMRGINPEPKSMAPDIVVVCVSVALLVLSAFVIWLPYVVSTVVWLRVRSAVISIGLLALASDNVAPLIVPLLQLPLLSGAIVLGGTIAVMGCVHRRLEMSGTIDAFQRAVLIVVLPIAVIESVRMGTLRFALTGWPTVSQAAPRHRGVIQGGSYGKIVVLIFDEMDASVAFRQKPEAVVLPNFDRLAREAVVFDDVYSASDWTALSIPVFLTGMAVDKVFVPDQNTYMIRESKARQWWRIQDVDGVFAQAKRSVGRVEIFGWYLPYCKLFGGSADECDEAPSVGFQWEASVRHFIEKQSVFVIVKTIWDYYYFRVVGRMYSDYVAPAEVDTRLWVFARQVYSAWVSDCVRRVQDALASGEDKFIWIHLPVPHPPALDGEASYLSGLYHADRILGELRSTLEAAGQWDSTTLIVTSDHALRSFWFDYSIRDVLGLERSMTTVGSVPLIVRFRGQRHPVRISNRISNGVVHELITRVLAGRVGVVNVGIVASEYQARQVPTQHAYPF